MTTRQAAPRLDRIITRDIADGTLAPDPDSAATEAVWRYSPEVFNGGPFVRSFYFEDSDGNPVAAATTFAQLAAMVEGVRFNFTPVSGRLPTFPTGETWGVTMTWAGGQVLTARISPDPNARGRQLLTGISVAGNTNAFLTGPVVDVDMEFQRQIETPRTVKFWAKRMDIASHSVENTVIDSTVASFLIRNLPGVDWIVGLPDGVETYFTDDRGRSRILIDVDDSPVGLNGRDFLVIHGRQASLVQIGG